MKAKTGFSFEQVKQKIFTYISDDEFDKSNCKFSYLDNDNDWVIFSSTEEFMELTEATFRHTTLRLKVEEPNHTFEPDLKKQSYEQPVFPIIQPQPTFNQQSSFGSQPQYFGNTGNTSFDLGSQQQQKNGVFTWRGSPQQPIRSNNGFNFHPPLQQQQQSYGGFGSPQPQQLQPQQPQQETKYGFNFGNPQQQPQQYNNSFTSSYPQQQQQPQKQQEIQKQDELSIDEIKPVFKTETKYVCDNCVITKKDMKGIVGPRFHCLICDNFDACEDCFQSIESIHSEHKKFVKITNKDEEMIDLTPKENHSTNPTVKENPKEIEEEKESEESQQLALLQQMGFTDDSKNIEMLKKHNGNFTTAVQELLTGL